MSARAALRDEFDRGLVRLLVAIPVGDGHRVLLEDGSWFVVGPGEAAPANAGLLLPSEAVDAVAEAFHPRAGHKVEVTRLEEALAVERRRVDLILGQISGVAE